MQNNLPTYPHYKPSGIQWLGDIPEHWEVKRFMNSFNLSKGLTITKENLKEEGVLCVNYGEIHSKYAFVLNPDVHKLKCVDFEYLKKSPNSLLNNGDFVFADTSEDIEGSGNFTHLESNESVFAGYHTIIARPIANFLPKFVAYELDSLSFRSQIRSKVKGVKVYSITQSILNELKIWLPPLPEQSAIAQFLDRKTALIDKAIGLKEKQIELLKERRQILIHQAVTRGLNPDVPMKDSGVEWIGEIPEHWEILKVKNVFQLIIDPAPKNNGQELLSVYTDIGVKPRAELEERGNKASTTDGYWIVKKGDIVVNKLLAWMGAIGISDYDGVTSPAYDILRAKRPIEGYFYHNLFRTPICISELRKHSRGIMDMRLRLYFDKFGDVRIPYPPRKEQIEIVTYIESTTKKIDTAIGLKEQEIEKLKEYKASLINSVVTGKVKVTENLEG